MLISHTGFVQCAALSIALIVVSSIILRKPVSKLRKRHHNEVSRANVKLVRDRGNLTIMSCLKVGLSALGPRNAVNACAGFKRSMVVTI